MKWTIEEMNEKRASEIISWKYEAPYNFYNLTESEESLKELLEGGYRAVLDISGELAGFFCLGKSAQVPSLRSAEIYSENLTDIGLGMKPELTGRGNGAGFLSCIFECMDNELDVPALRLTVAAFNQRAIRLYEKMGFMRQDEFENDFAKFIVMVKR